ncbi:NACHT domain-containing NTPase [Nocardiopsis sp. JB363]|uniref:NACHT domain-containing protein n=1 Tax=Nocardiopsis sp. JB363 TaxID=1434837 RepID=UPI000B355CEE|nr:AAA family ATPase [Nocardiopsis sp. JB363]
MAKLLGYADALKVLGKQDRPVLDFAEKLADGGLSAIGVGDLFGAREFLVGQGRKALENLEGKLRGTSRLTRTQRIEAAHQVLLVVSFFEPLDECLREAGMRLRATDLEMTGDEQWELLDRALRAESVHSPEGAFVWDQQDLFGRAEAVFQEASHHLHRLIAGLAAVERTDTGPGSRLAHALGEVLPQRSLESYRGHYLAMRAEAPEFGIWAQLREHEQTRRRVSDAFDGLREELGRFSSLREVGDLRRMLSLKYRAKLNRPILPLDEVLPDALPPGMEIPALKDCYVPPSARVARVSRGQDPSTPVWWEVHESLPDLQHFLVSRFTHPDAIRYPTVVLGEPGGGKSKLTEVLSAQLPEEDFLVVRVELRSVNADADVHRQIEEGLAHEHRDQITWRELLAEADGALPVVILDGFDELLQASGMDRHNYLEQIQDFQRHQEEVEQPVAVLVTSRTLSASRVRFPENTTVIRLEPFDQEQVGRVLRAWNKANWRLFGTTNLRELALGQLMAYPELSRQPLLLLLLLVYDTQDNALQRAPGSLSLGELYERLLTTFVHRQIRKHWAELSERDLKKEVQKELRRLEVTALAMFTRQRQSVASEELEGDLKEFRLGQDSHRMERPQGRRVRTAQQLLSRFFFVHVSEAQIKGTDETAQSSYEFLHATFGEYLVARMIGRTLRSLVNDYVRHLEDDSWDGEPPNDGFLYATSSFACFGDREKILEFLKELLGKDIDGIEERRRHYGELLIELFREAPFPSANRLHSAYQPRGRIPLTNRQAYYTANLLTLLLIARGEQVDIAELFTESAAEPSTLHQWRAAASLWRALPGTDWFTVLDTLRVRHLKDGRSLLRSEDLSRVNVGESLGFELRRNPALLAKVIDPYAISVPIHTQTGQMLRSMALRANGTAALLAISFLPALRLNRMGLELQRWFLEPSESSKMEITAWSPTHELLLLRLLPDRTEWPRRLDAYRRFLRFDNHGPLGQTGLAVLRQAAEDLKTTDPYSEYGKELVELVTDFLKQNTAAAAPPFTDTESVDSAWHEPPVPTTGERTHSENVGAVLHLLAPYLPPDLLDRVRQGVDESTAAIIEMDEPPTPTTHFTSYADLDEHSVVDLKPFLGRPESGG